jgi:mannitol-specific phosphotransferase system IIBC component
MTDKFDKTLNSKLAIIVSIVFIVTAVVTVVLAVGVRATEIESLKEKTQQLEEKKVDKAVYETAINNIEKTTQRIENKLDRLIQKNND